MKLLFDENLSPRLPRALTEPIYIQIPLTFTNADWEAQTTQPFGSTLKTTAAQLFRKTPTFRIEAFSMGSPRS